LRRSYFIRKAKKGQKMAKLVTPLQSSVWAGTCRLFILKLLLKF